MHHAELDHLVITAPSLENARQYLQRVLGVAPQTGGKHTRMGTHNCLVKLGEMTYLEGIAVDPNTPRPERPRWFGLDSLQENSPPRLAAWVLRVNDIEAAAAASPVPLGTIEHMTRGSLRWRITIPADGSPPLQGIAPLLIQWEPGPHPASRLENTGCSLLRLEGFHPQAKTIAAMLKAIGFTGVFGLAPLPAQGMPCLVATIRTPAGVISMGSL
jgi:hypothetical protein